MKRYRKRNTMNTTNVFSEVKTLSSGKTEQLTAIAIETDTNSYITVAFHEKHDEVDIDNLSAIVMNEDEAIRLAKSILAHYNVTI